MRPKRSRPAAIAASAAAGSVTSRASGEDLVGVGGDEVVELLGPAGGGDELVAGVEDGLGDRATEAAARAGEEEDGGGGGIGGHLGSLLREQCFVN